MKLVALLRVSTRGQAEDGFGLEVQEKAVRAWAKIHRHTLVAVLTEQISGAAPMTTRRGLQTALTMVTKHEADGLLVPCLDRLSRTLYVQEQIIAFVEDAGAVVRSVNPTEDAQLTGEADDPQRRLIRQLLGSIYEYERAMIRLRLKAGKDAKRAATGYAGGRPPYGWVATGRELRPVEHEQEVRRAIKAWAREGWSTRKIAARLNADGIKTRHGKQWQAAQIARIINDKRRAVVNPNAPAPQNSAKAVGEVISF